MARCHLVGEPYLPQANGPIAKRSAEADVVAFADRHADRRISLREIALSHS